MRPSLHHVKKVYCLLLVRADFIGSRPRVRPTGHGELLKLFLVKIHHLAPIIELQRRRAVRSRARVTVHAESHLSPRWNHMTQMEACSLRFCRGGPPGQSAAEHVHLE